MSLLSDWLLRDAPEMIVSCRSCLAHLESLARESKVHITKEVFLVGRVQKVSGQQRETCPNFSAAGFTNDLVIQQKFVSRHHSCICHHGTTWEIRDCHSLCGVYVNRKKIDGSSPLKTGDEIWFGAKEERFLFKSFLLDEAPPSAEPIESAKQLLTSLGVDKKKAYLNFLHSVTCPICKDVLCYPILTNCQHLYLFISFLNHFLLYHFHYQFFSLFVIKNLNFLFFLHLLFHSFLPLSFFLFSPFPSFCSF